MSLLARVRDSVTFFQSNVCNLFYAGDLAAVRIIGVCVITGCPLGESWLYRHLNPTSKKAFLARVHVEKLKKRHSSERNAAFRIL